jgi:hypothetical protein
MNALKSSQADLTLELRVIFKNWKFDNIYTFNHYQHFFPYIHEILNYWQS